MRHRALRLIGLVLITACLGACDKCADNYLANPFAPSKPAGCHEEPSLK